MLPIFLVEETTVRESGESAVFDASEHSNQNLLLTFGITHAVEHESIGIDIHGSKDGLDWPPKPIVSFAPKSYCGTYQLIAAAVKRDTSRLCGGYSDGPAADHRPFFRFYLFAEPGRALVRMAGAA